MHAPAVPPAAAGPRHGLRDPSDTPRGGVARAERVEQGAPRRTPREPWRWRLHGIFTCTRNGISCVRLDGIAAVHNATDEQLAQATVAGPMWPDLSVMDELHATLRVRPKRAARRVVLILRLGNPARNTLTRMKCHEQDSEH